MCDLLIQSVHCPHRQAVSICRSTEAWRFYNLQIITRNVKKDDVKVELLRTLYNSKPNQSPEHLL
jgi:hypothetical protein